MGGLEHPTYALSERRSNQLSYIPECNCSRGRAFLLSNRPSWIYFANIEMASEMLPARFERASSDLQSNACTDSATRASNLKAC